MQLHTDAGVRGRVMALYLMIFMGGTPVGAPIIGWIGEEYGARWTLLGGGMLTIAGVAVSALHFYEREGLIHSGQILLHRVGSPFAVGLLDRLFDLGHRPLGQRCGHAGCGRR